MQPAVLDWRGKQKPPSDEDVVSELRIFTRAISEINIMVRTSNDAGIATSVATSAIITAATRLNVLPSATY